MDTCTSCGAQLGLDRSCARCGAPVAAYADWRTGTAERPALAEVPVAPELEHDPPPLETPGAPRFPLYADEAGSARPEPPAIIGPLPAAPPSADLPSGRSFGWLPVVVGAAALLLAAALGALLLLGPETEESESATDAGAVAPTLSPPSEPAPPPGQPDPETDQGGQDGQKPGQKSKGKANGKSKARKKLGPPQNLARKVRPTVPDTAPPNQDVSANTVRYGADNMLDGNPRTAWRMPGDGTGEEIVLRLAKKARLTRVGLINGYAKKAGSFDWYQGNRRIESVIWTFDDETSVRQKLTESRRLQSVKIPSVKTSTVRLRLDRVSAPGTGRASRNYTAISEVELVGRRR